MTFERFPNNLSESDMFKESKSETNDLKEIIQSHQEIISELLKKDSTLGLTEKIRDEMHNVFVKYLSLLTSILCIFIIILAYLKIKKLRNSRLLESESQQSL